MPILNRQEKEGIDRRRSLDGVPILNPGVTIDTGDGGKMYVRMKIGRGPSFFDRFRPAVMEKKYELDDFGAFVAGRVDGNRTVAEIITDFEKRFKMSRRESEFGVVAFMKTLMKRGVLSVVIRKEMAH